MFCTNCGAKLDEDSSFCTECGSAIQPLSESELDRTQALNMLNKTAEFPAVEGQSPNNTAYYSQPTQQAGTPQGAAPNYSVPVAQGTQGGAQAAAKSGNSALMIVALIVGIIAIVICATLLILAVTKPPIDFLKDTPFSSVQTQSQEQVADSNNNSDSSNSGSSNNNSGSNNSGNNSSGNSNSSNGSSGNSDSGSSGYSSNSEKYSYNKNRGEQILPFSSSVRISLADVKGLSSDEMCIAKNEIWARHGRKFDNKWLQNYFNQQSWYTPTTDPDDFLKVYSPTDIENDNAALLNSILEERGYEVNKVHPN